MAGLDITALEIFRTVAREGSVTSAAVHLNRVQSNVSTRLRQLEDHLQSSLFVRRNGGWSLTPEGEILLTYAHRLLDLSVEAQNALLGNGPTGRFRIGAMESTAGTRLPAILSAFHRDHPRVESEVVTDTAGGLLRRLSDHDIDAAFVAEPVDASLFATCPVFREELTLIAPASYPETCDPAALSGQTMIAFETGCAYRRYLEMWLNECGVVPKTTISLGSYLAILASVFAGTGFAIVPSSVLDLISSRGEIRRYPLPNHIARVRTLLVWRKDYLSLRLKTLMEYLPDMSSTPPERQ